MCRVMGVNILNPSEWLYFVLIKKKKGKKDAQNRQLLSLEWVDGIRAVKIRES